MKAYSTEPLQRFENDQFGRLIRIYWNEQMIQFPNQLHDGFITQYSYDTAEIQQGDSRSVIIETIIASQYTTGRELATINNQDVDPDSYAEYQAFRQTAKDLADEYLATL